MKGIAGIIGFDWIANQTLKKIVRLLFNCGLVFAAATPVGAPVLAILGIAPSATASAIVGGVLAVVESIRNEVKHADDKPL